MSLPDGQLRGVVAGDQLDQAQRAGASNFDLAHMANVEEPRSGAYGFVLSQNARVLERHVPAAEIHHLGAELAMDGIQSCLAQFSGCRCGHRGFLIIATKHRS